MPNKRRRLPRAVREIRKSDLFRSLEWALRDHRGDGMLDDETALADALANLRHIADKQRVNWKEVVRRADNHYNAESASPLVGRRMRTRVTDSNDATDGTVQIPVGWLATIGEPIDGEHFPVKWDDGPGGLDMGWCLWTEEEIRRDADLLEVTDGPKR